MGDVVGGSHPPRGHGREVGVADLWCDVCMALDMDKAGSGIRLSSLRREYTAEAAVHCCRLKC